MKLAFPPKKILIFGGAGFVGRNLARMASREGWEVCIADSTAPSEDIGFHWMQGDITKAGDVDGIIREAKPSAVVNLAAISDIDKAQNNGELAYRVNVTGAQNIAKSCAKAGAKYLFFSSDAVFSGEETNYTEEDKPNPLNYYGKTKMEAEREVITANPDAIVIRISLIVGFAIDGGNSFLEGLYQKLKSGAVIACPEDEVRTPVDVTTLCASVLELLQSDFSGILHIGATQSIDRYAMTLRFATMLGYGASQVSLQKGQVAGRAPRHKNGVICVEKAQSILKTPMQSIEATLEGAVKSRENKFWREV